MPPFNRQSQNDEKNHSFRVNPAWFGCTCSTLLEPGMPAQLEYRCSYFKEIRRYDIWTEDVRSNPGSRDRVCFLMTGLYLFVLIKSRKKCLIPGWFRHREKASSGKWQLSERENSQALTAKPIRPTGRPGGRRTGFRVQRYNVSRSLPQTIGKIRG